LNAAQCRILVADDESSIVSFVRKALSDEGYAVCTASGGKEAVELATREQPHLALLDLMMPDMSGLDALKLIRSSSPSTRVMIITAFATAETAVEAMKQGALDYIIKPFSLEEIKLQVRRALAEVELSRENVALKEELERTRPERPIIGESAALKKSLEMVEKLAGDASTVLVVGETGTGKEMVARALHRKGAARRKGGPFLAINCGALSESLLERELFGHEKGAFTRADSSRGGLLEAAGEGTLFLDEIAEMSPNLQVKLLRVLDGNEYMRVGGTRPLRCHARFIAATNKALGSLVKEGKFRQDLYYRLNVVTITLPPLRDRERDVHLLADCFLERSSRAHGRTGLTFAPAARDALSAYQWPGNIRELENVIERVTMLAKGPVIEAADLMLESTGKAENLMLEAWCSLPHSEARDVFERFYIAKVLKACGGNITRTAERIGIDRKNLEDKIRKHGLKPSS
jgi:two-component system response regulator AtoC